MSEYSEFLEQKRPTLPDSGLAPAPVHEILYPFQRAIVEWAVRRGRAAIFADCGMGKTLMQLEWARQMGSNGRVLIIAPLAVGHQTEMEAKKIDLDAKYLRSDDPTVPVVITNYEMVGRFDPAGFAGVVLDESSILKSFMGKTKQLLVSTFRDTPFRLCCTATPAPNDHMELGNHSAFLGIMPSNEMLSRWFINDTMEAGNYRLKKHAATDFWRWIGTWAVCLSKPSDIGDFDDRPFVLPSLNIEVTTIPSPPPPGRLFETGRALSATEMHGVKRQTATLRAETARDLIAGASSPCLVWCDTNYEADALRKAIPGAVDVRGSDPLEKKEQCLSDFADGDISVLITKPKIAGHGMNFQVCNRIVFVGLSYSFEQFYQAVRRVWRFGQTSNVTVHIIETEAEKNIRQTVDAKFTRHGEMLREMAANIGEGRGGMQLVSAPEPLKTTGKNWEMWLGDSVEVLDRIEADSVDFSIFSPPFSNLYIYSDSIADMGNSQDHDEFFQHFGYMIDKLYRATTNGRLCAVHCKDLPSYMGRDGAAGLIDFPGMCIREFERHGWQYHSRVTIWKDPVIEMQRTKNHGLLHKQLCKDSSASRQGMADYIVVFRKWDGTEFPKPVHGPNDERRFEEYVGDEPPDESDPRQYSIHVWQRYASPVWFDIRQTNVLHGHREARGKDDERHICPLQLDVIERCVKLWTNEGDVVFSPFVGIGSEGFVAVKHGRRFVGIELKKEYFDIAVRNLTAASKQNGRLF